MIMAGKPTYEELMQRIQELEKTEFELKKTQKALKESEDRYRSVVEDMQRRDLLWPECSICSWALRIEPS